MSLIPQLIGESLLAATSIHCCTRIVLSRTQFALKMPAWLQTLTNSHQTALWNVLFAAVKGNFCSKGKCSPSYYSLLSKLCLQTSWCVPCKLQETNNLLAIKSIARRFTGTPIFPERLDFTKWSLDLCDSFVSRPSLGMLKSNRS